MQVFLWPLQKPRQEHVRRAKQSRCICLNMSNLNMGHSSRNLLHAVLCLHCLDTFSYLMEELLSRKKKRVKANMAQAETSPESGLITCLLHPSICTWPSATLQTAQQLKIMEAKTNAHNLSHPNAVHKLCLCLSVLHWRSLLPHSPSSHCSAHQVSIGVSKVSHFLVLQSGNKTGKLPLLAIV